MPVVHFTANLRRHVSCPTVTVAGATVNEALAAVFEHNPRLRGYVLDDQGAVRKHMNVFVDGVQVRDRVSLADPVAPDSEIYVIQALSGG
jgi:sulfur-carrier protein